VYKVDPKDLRECVVVLCNETGKTTSCKDLAGSGKLQCDGKSAKMIWQIQFLVKDSASQLNKNFFRVMLFSGGPEGAGHEFFGA